MKSITGPLPAMHTMPVATRNALIPLAPLRLPRWLPDRVWPFDPTALELAVMGSGVVRRIDLSTGAIARITSTSVGVGRHLDEASRRAYRDGLMQELGACHDYLR
jgi:hypothetical protein